MGSKNKKSSAAAIKQQALGALKFQNMLGMEYNKGRRDGYTIAVIIISWVLHKEYGFGKMRLAKLLRQVNDFCNDYIAIGSDGVRKAIDGFQGLSLQDIVDALADECDLFVNLQEGTLEIKGVQVIRESEK